MELLDTLPNLSIAELRKVLSDNEIQESPGTESREDLLNQVSEVLLTNMMIKDTMENEKVVDEKTILREQQDKEYESSLNEDLLKNEKEIFEELSPRSLREKRLQYFMNSGNE